MGCGGSKHGAARPASRADMYVSDAEAKLGDLSRMAPKVVMSEFHKEYVLGAKLGQGSFGSVYTAHRPEDAIEVAVKIIDPRAKDAQGHRLKIIDRKARHAVEREVCMLQVIPQSPNVVQFHGVYSGGDLAYMVMEQCSMKLLQVLEAIPVLTEASLKPIFKDMFSGVASCHAVGLAHRDIKPDNFMANPVPGSSGFCIKLCDFGLSSRVSTPEARELTGIFGTPPFMAPEMLVGAAYSAKVDVWALGVLAYVMVYGCWPYMPSVLSGPAMKQAIQEGTPAPRFRGRAGLAVISEPCTSWVQSLLRRDPTDRISAHQATQHRSFTKAWCPQASLANTLGAAKRVGAFELPGRASVHAAPSDLDRYLQRLSEQGRASLAAVSRVTSEASTDVGSDSPFMQR